MALLSDNNYYWKKLIFASNLIYISRILNYLKDAYFYYVNMEEQGYKSLIVVFIYGICGDYYWGDLVGESQFRRFYIIIKYGGIRGGNNTNHEKSKLMLKHNDRVGKILKVKDIEFDIEFDDQLGKKVYEDIL
ncbi:11429_t:CDS:1 [Acaulospora morrowiae]|uniref:11429_t:CDS:1 n=1 Tax=Acaulospora morrowiae TaxID=94023 RepID=A0A9N9GR12_9GLOM|nr:11429_t:CDS:1 [Acaulospora morrowiae]